MKIVINKIVSSFVRVDDSAIPKARSIRSIKIL